MSAVWILVFWFIVGFLVSYYLAEWQRGVKFHIHNWKLTGKYKKDSFYSDKMVNIHYVYRCNKDNCTGFKVRTDTVRRDRVDTRPSA